ncbi:MAG: DNA repair protein RecO [Longimicrobiales bacterium]
MSLVATPAILLRSHPYSETSRILRFYSRDAGVVAVMAKGIRKTGGKRGGSDRTFGEGRLTFYHKEGRELQTYRDFDLENPRPGLSGDPLRFAGASVLGEVVLQHAGSDGNPALFQRLSAGLDTLATEAEELLVRRLLLEIWGLVAELGYAPTVLACVNCGRELDGEELGRFDFAAGGLKCPSCQEGAQGPRLGPKARKQLQGLVAGVLEGDLIRPRAHLRLASDFITYHISGGSPLRSMEVVATLVPKDHA